MNTFDRINLRTKPSPSLPPQGYKTIYHDPESGTFKAVDFEGNEQLLGGGPADVIAAMQAFTASQEIEARTAIGAEGIRSFNVKDYGAAGDGMMLHDAVITSGDQTVTSATASFPSDIAGKYCRVAGGTTAGVNQVETATAAGTITASGTLNVTITGAGIAGSPLTLAVNVVAGDTAATWAGKVRNYLANTLQLFDRYYVSGSSTSIVLTGKRPRANDATLNIALANGTCTGVTAAPTSANTTAGVATVDLITTVASRNSATSIELTAAPGRSGTGVTIYYGTDDTDAVQDAIDSAAASATVRKVYFPPGVYLGNWTGKAHVHLVGADGGLTEFEFDTGGPLPDLSDRSIVPVAMIPAVASEPVIHYPGAGKIYGASIENIAIFGSKEQVGAGLQLGEQDNAGSQFCGGGFRLKQVLITGFEYAFSASKVAQMQADNCLFLYSRVCAFLGQLGLAIGPCDTSVFNSCGTGGANCDANWFISDARGITINGGDHNDGKHVGILLNGTTATVNGINSESTTESPWILATANLTWNSSSLLHMNGPMLDMIGNDNTATINDIRVGAAGANARWQNKLIFCRTDQTTGQPDKLPKGGVIARYKDFGWNDLQVTEYTSEVYANQFVADRRPVIKDEFVSGYETTNSAGPFSDLKWVKTAVAGATPNVLAPSQPTWPGNSFGMIYVTPSSTSSANILRFALPIESYLPTAGYWRMRWRLQLLDSAVGRFRVGLYSLDAAAGDNAKPKNGIGFRIDRSVPDANIQFEVINNETSTVVDTGIPYTQLDTSKEIQIWRTAEGLFFGMFQPFYQGGAILYPFVEHSSDGTVNDYLAPSMTIGASTTGAPAAIIDHFSLMLFENGFA